MKILKSLIIAFSMYSKIPMPHVGWKDDDMRYVLAFFPLVGVVIAAAEYICIELVMGGYLETSQTFKTAIAVALPILITGGIHLDGFMDASDALSSYKTKEERLRILKDPHIGAFAVIHVIALTLIFYGTVDEIISCRDASEWMGSFGSFCLIFILSRIMSAFSVMLIKPAGNKGTLETFSRASSKKPVLVMLAVELLTVAAAMLHISFFIGIITILTAVIVFLIYRHIAMKAFGGVTGDTSGWFLCVTECACTFSMAMAIRLLYLLQARGMYFHLLYFHL